MKWTVTITDMQGNNPEEIEIEADSGVGAIAAAHRQIRSSGGGRKVGLTRQIPAGVATCYWCSETVPLGGVWTLQPVVLRPDATTSVLDPMRGHQECASAALARLYAKTVGESVALESTAR